MPNPTMLDPGGVGPAARTRLSLLRDFELEHDGMPVDVAHGTQRLIGFLAFQGGRPVRRSYVSGTLWADSTEPRACANLRSALWRSPVFGGTAVVRSTPTHLWLSPDIDVDLAASTTRAKELLDLHSVDPGAIDVMVEVRAFGDDLLVGWYDEWVNAERERFRHLRLHVLDQLGELLIRAHRYAEAVQVGLVAIASDELRESAHRILVRAHLSEGNLAEALRQYRSYATLLAEELGVRPSGAMEEIIAAAVSSVSRPIAGRVATRRMPAATA